MTFAARDGRGVASGRGASLPSSRKCGDSPAPPVEQGAARLLTDSRPAGAGFTAGPASITRTVMDRPCSIPLPSAQSDLCAQQPGRANATMRQLRRHPQGWRPTNRAAFGPAWSNQEPHGALALLWAEHGILNQHGQDIMNGLIGGFILTTVYTGIMAWAFARGHSRWTEASLGERGLVLGTVALMWACLACAAATS